MISVIIPYWNAENWLERCLKSLRRQGGDFEFLLVNDNSSDYGAEIAEKYAAGDDRFVLLDNERGKGVSGARNTGLDYARGEWITFLDADDEMLPDAFRILNMVARSNKGANIFQMNHKRYYTAIDKIVMKYTNERKLFVAPDLPDCWWGVWNKLYRAELLKGIRFQEGLQYGEDGLFNLECIARDGRIQHASHSIAVVKHRFDNKESLSHLKNAEKLLLQIRAYEDFIFRQSDPMIRQLVCNLIAELWESPRAMELIGQSWNDG